MEVGIPFSNGKRGNSNENHPRINWGAAAAIDARFVRQMNFSTQNEHGPSIKTRGVATAHRCLKVTRGGVIVIIEERVRPLVCRTSGHAT